MEARDMYAAEMKQAAEKFARKCGADDETAAVAVAIAWTQYEEYEGDGWWPAWHWARIGVLHALAGRDIRGMKTRESKKDAMHGVILGLGDAVYGGPGPDKLAEDREHGELWLASLTGQELTCVELMTEGTYSQVEIAFIMNISTTRVCQILKRARAKWHEVG